MSQQYFKLIVFKPSILDFQMMAFFHGLLLED
uniref:Uncharacterized protein n=1 Tax=Rhizophora mucronata TaxID=61149 RepID=A0A2P2PVR7_RHIMU